MNNHEEKYFQEEIFQKRGCNHHQISSANKLSTTKGKIENMTDYFLQIPIPRHIRKNPNKT